MADKKEILTISISKDLIKRIEDFRYEKRIPSRSETIRLLLEEGLKKHGRGETDT